MKIAVVTSSIGSNRLLDPIPFDGVDYHAFVDDSVSNNKWITHPTISFSSDPTYLIEGMQRYIRFFLLLFSRL